MILPQFIIYYQKRLVIFSRHQYGPACLTTNLWKVLTVSLVTNPITYNDLKGGVYRGVLGGLTEGGDFMSPTPKCFWKALAKIFHVVLKLAKLDKLGNTWLNLAKFG